MVEHWKVIQGSHGNEQIFTNENLAAVKYY